jgi:putative ABC transport system permease protein
VLIGVRINARRPHRARLVTLNTFVTAAALAAVLMSLAIDSSELLLHDSELPSPRDERVVRALLVIVGVVCALALLNTVASTWTAVLDARHPLAVARTLGATPVQAGLGLAVAQLLPAAAGVAAGIPFGIGLFRFFERGGAHDMPVGRLVGAGLAVVLVVAALTAVPALAVARRPVADTLGSTPT